MTPPSMKGTGVFPYPTPPPATKRQSFHRICFMTKEGWEREHDWTEGAPKFLLRKDFRQQSVWKATEGFA